MLTFLGIGAQKSGTTWLYEHLRSHPDISFPAGKEVHYWDRPDNRPIHWYRSLFEASNVLNGEITPAYGALPVEAIEKVYTNFPHLRLFYIIRHPVERAWSSAVMALTRAEMQLDEASDQWFLDHFNSRASLSKGDYGSCIKNWRSVFGPEKLLICQFDDILTNPSRILEQIAHHVGADPGPFQDMDETVLRRRIFAGSGAPIRPTLRAALNILYRDKISSLERYLGCELRWHLI